MLKLIVIICCIFMFVSCSKTIDDLIPFTTSTPGNSFSDEEDKTWTILIYANEISEFSKNAQEQISLMNNLSLSNDINVIIATRTNTDDFNTNYNKMEQNIFLYKISSFGSAPELVDTLHKMNLDDPRSSTIIIETIFSMYQSDRFGIIYWGETNSWKQKDEKNLTTNKFLATKIKEGIEKSGIENTVPLEFLIFDSSLMGSNEAAAEFIGLTNVYIANGGFNFGNKTDYSSFLSYLSENPNATYTEIAKKEVELWEAAHTEIDTTEDLLKAHIALDMNLFTQYMSSWSTLNRKIRLYSKDKYDDHIATIAAYDSDYLLIPNIIAKASTFSSPRYDIISGNFLSTPLLTHGEDLNKLKDHYKNSNDSVNEKIITEVIQSLNKNRSQNTFTDAKQYLSYIISELTTLITLIDDKTNDDNYKQTYKAYYSLQEAAQTTLLYLESLIIASSIGEARVDKGQCGLQFETNNFEHWYDEEYVYNYKKTTWDFETFSYKVNKVIQEDTESGSAPTITVTTDSDSFAEPSEDNLPTFEVEATTTDFDDAKIILGMTENNTNYSLGVISQEETLKEDQEYNISWRGNIFSLTDGSTKEYPYISEIIPNKIVGIPGVITMSNHDTYSVIAIASLETYKVSHFLIKNTMYKTSSSTFSSATFIPRLMISKTYDISAAGTVAAFSIEDWELEPENKEKRLSV
ncbi:MAG: hypothetical protein HOJ35_08140 [Bdellovibrionales bacterium]|nr:hypothetical protein [Bdellovibrionales bacterium]